MTARITLVLAGLAAVASCGNSFAQEQELEEILGNIDSAGEEETDAGEVEWLIRHPLDLNAVSADDLHLLPMLSPEECTRIIQYRRMILRFDSLDQLDAVPGLDHVTANRIKSFLFVPSRAPSPKAPFLLELRVRNQRSLELRKGYVDGFYPGTPDRTYLRLAGMITPGIEAGILAEKDPGEKWKNGFASGFVAYSGNGLLHRAVLGDYRVRPGQGLTLWVGPAFRKGGDPVSSGRRSDKGIQPARSSDELNYFRGAAITLKTESAGRAFSVSAFYSSQPVPLSSSLSENTVRFHESGLFRTESEIGKRGSAEERVIGGLLRYGSPKDVSIGLTFCTIRYRSRRAQDEPSEEEIQHTLAGIDLSVPLRDAEMFGEMTATSGGRLRWIAGGRINAGRSHRVIVSYRWYPPDGMTGRVSGFGERAGTENEQGFYIGVRTRPFAGFSLGGFLDLFSFPGGTSSLRAAVSGHELSLEPGYRWKGGLLCSLRYVWKSAPSVIQARDVFGRQREVYGERQQHRFRLTLERQFGRMILLRGRVEWTHVSYVPGDPASESGMLLSQEIRFSPRSGFSVQMRVSFYQTDSYDSRIYQFETDVPGSYRIPVLYNKGTRWYLSVRSPFFGLGELSLKYAGTLRDGETGVGSGADTITGDTERQLSIQYDLRL